MHAGPTGHSSAFTRHGCQKPAVARVCQVLNKSGQTAQPLRQGACFTVEQVDAPIVLFRRAGPAPACDGPSIRCEGHGEDLPLLPFAYRRAQNAQQRGAVGDIPHPHGFVFGTGHQDLVGRIHGEGEDARAVGAQLHAQDGFVGLSPGTGNRHQQ